MNARIDALQGFHPAVRGWFARALGEPTLPQLEAWPAIMAGKHTLVAAPTGSGKTLAAFFVAINELVQQGLECGSLPDATTVLYVSPLKALGNDIQRNLNVPLEGIAEELQLLGLPPVDIRVAVRSGDTPQQQRQRMVKRPPHILVTTPESLYLLLTSKGGRKLLSTVRSVIVDEIHALLGDKRGAHLSLSLERLQNLLPHPLQRIGLSATQKPIERVAQYLVGNPAGDSDCVIVDSGHRRQLDIKVEVPASPLSALMSNEVWDELYQRLVQLVEAHRTTLVFVNTRRLAERLGLALANRIGAEHVSSHHGSMSKELRFDAEQRLKHGQLKVLVATASMELGIDVGAVELVVQFSSPKRIAAFLQRVGRSGHFVGGLPKGVLFPLTRDDLVECTALIDSIRRGELDRIVIPDKPLDILSQQLVAELGSLEDMGFDASLDELWLWVSRSWSYRNLTHAEFEAIVRMLAEGYSTRRGRSGTLLHHDQINDRVRARKGARLMALTNGGAIPDMFDYQVVLDPEDVVVGSLNEDFALEAIPGDIFSLGNHSWRLLKIDGLKVRVADAQGQPPTLPFWIGEGPGRSRELSEAVSRLRSELHLRFEHSLAAGQQWLQDEVGLDLGAAEQLATYLFTGSRALNVMPTRDCLVMERFFDEVGDMHLVIHAPFGSRVNKAWGLALRKRFCRSFNFELQAAANEDSIVISLGSVHSFELAEVFRYLQSATVRDILVQALLDAPMFEVRWRWNASRALAVQRNRNGKRVPPQFQRMAAEDFVAQVFPDQLACLENISGPREVPQHPLVQQTINDCLSEAMDIDELEEIVRRIESNQVELVARDLREPSPFAQEIINARPYAFLDDAPFEERRTLAIRNRSWIDPAETEDFSALDITAIERVKDEAWPWVRSPDELHEALMLLGFMTEDELQGNATQPDNSVFLEPLLKQGRVTQARHGKHRLWIASERQPQFAALDAAWSFKPAVQLPAALAQQLWSHESALVEILRGRLEGLGPVRASVLAAPLGLSVSQAQQGLLALEMEGFAFQGHYTPLTGAVADTMRTPQGGAQPKAGSVQEKEWCERRLLQRIHRYTIDAHRESIKPVSLQVYMQYLFELHGVQPVGREELLSAATAQTLAQVLQQLDGTTAPATAWEADILPVRLPNYDPAWLDQLCISGHLCWGRILQPREHSGEVRKSGPVKSTPLNLVQRSNLDLWQLLAAQDDSAARPEDVRAGSAGSGVESSARSGAEHDTANSSATHPASTEPAGLSSAATLIYGILQQRGACFFTDLARLTGLMAVQVEQALAELVSSGLVTSDNFTGLRALLTPDANKPKQGSHERRRAIYGIEDAGRWSLLALPGVPGAQVTKSAAQLDDEQLERLLRLYLQRWGVLNRRVLEREQNAPPWRVLLLKLRRMELRGDIRGGRFIAGIGGEQFALAETVDALRRRHKLWQQELERDPTQRSTVRVVLNATDPLNLLGTLLPEKRVPHLSGNRILFEDGVPVAVLEKETARCLQPAKEDRLWDYQQVLQRRYFPPRLRAYLGKV